MIRGNVFFEVEKIEQLALINRLTTHHDLRPSLKGSDDGIMIRQYPRGLFQQHRSKGDLPPSLRPCLLCPLKPDMRDVAAPARVHSRAVCVHRVHAAMVLTRRGLRVDTWPRLLTSPTRSPNFFIWPAAAPSRGCPPRCFLRPGRTRDCSGAHTAHTGILQRM